MEIQNEIAKTKKRIVLLEHQNDKFKTLLEKALTVSLKPPESPIQEIEFLQESIELIEEEKENLKEDLSTLTVIEQPNIRTLVERIKNLEKLHDTQQEEIHRLKGEHAEIKFLLLHPESRNAEWLKNILKLENEVSSPSETSLIEERFRLQRKILNLEKKKAELLIAINDAVIPKNLGSFIKNDLENAVFRSLDNEELLGEYEDLRFKMLNLEDERSRLLGDLQCVLDRSRKEIAEEYSNLQEKIMAVEHQKANLRLCLSDPSCQKITNSELESIFNAFRNLPLSELEEKAREERVKTEIGTMFCPGVGLPMYCNIL